MSGQPDVASVVQSLWDRHSAWSAAANDLKRRRERARQIVLVLTITGAAAQTLAAVLDDGYDLVAGLVATVALTLVPFITGYFLTTDDTRRWLRARSISEGIKSEIYTFRAFADPYRGADALAVLAAKVKEISEWGADIETVAARAKYEPKPAPPRLDDGAYIETRVDQQIRTYYRPNANLNAARADQFRLAQIALAGLAAVMSAIATFLIRAGGATPSELRLGPWVAVLTTVAGSIAAYAAASRYDFQATTYFATARQLEDLANEWRQRGAVAPSDEWSAFVRSCEEVISAENRGWMAKLDDK